MPHQIKIRPNTGPETDSPWQVFIDDQPHLASDVMCWAATFSSVDKLPDGKVINQISCIADKVEWREKKLIID